MAERELTPEEVVALGLDSAPPEAPGLGARLLRRAMAGPKALARGPEALDDDERKTAREGAATLLGMTQGLTFGAADEIVGGLKALPRALARGQGVVDAYRGARDEEREMYARAQADSPWAYGLGEAGGAIAVPIPGPGKATGLARVGKMAMQGAGVGGAHALGHSDADLTKGEFVEAGKDTFKGGAIGGAGGAVGGAVANAAPHVANYLREKAINMGRRVLLGGADSLSSRAPVAAEAVEEAIQSGAIRPMSTTTKAWERLEQMTEEQGAKYRGILEALEKHGVQGPKAQTIADDLLARAAERDAGETNQALIDEFLARGQQAIQKAGGREHLGLSQAESLKSALQRDARWGRMEETPMNEVKREVASVFRQATEDAVNEAGRSAPGSEIQRLAEDFVPAKRRLGRLIEARDAADRGKQRASQRSGMSLNDTVMAAGGVASGNPANLLYALGNNVARNRGLSAATTGTYGLSNAMRGLGQSGRAPMSVPLLSNYFTRESADDLIPMLAEIDEERERQTALARALRGGQ